MLKVTEVTTPTALNRGKPVTIDSATAKQLLGWTVTENLNAMFKDHEGNKIDCSNNLKNRPLDMGKVRQLTQEMLQQRWRVNGEPIILGTSGILLNGQHTLVSVVMAEQIRTSEEQADHWATIHDGPIKIEKFVIGGIEESDDIVNTMDTCRPRTLSDMVYRSDYFTEQDNKLKKKLSTAADGAIKFLWQRTGVCHDPYSPLRTPSESLNWLDNHRTLIQVVSHVVEEMGGSDNLRKYLAPSKLAALCYLFAASKSSLEDYHNTVSEDDMDLSMLEKAEEFIVLLSSGAKEMKYVREAFAALVDPETGMDVGTQEHKIAILIRAWQKFSEGKNITAKSLEIGHKKDIEGYNVQIEYPIIGGIDQGPLGDLNQMPGDGADIEEEDGEEPEDDTQDETEDVIEQRKKKAEKLLQNREKRKKEKETAGVGFTLPEDSDLDI